MQVVILEKNKELAQSLKRALSLKHFCVIERSYNIEEIEKKYKGSKTTFIISESVIDEKGINEEGLKLAYLIKNRLNLKTIVISIEKKEKKTELPYLKIPFQLKDLHEAISKAFPIIKEIDESIILEKYEHFRAKISHDYLQYINKNWQFYKSLIINFSKYAKFIFGINFANKGIDESKINKIIDEYEKRRDPSILYSLLTDFKINEIKKSEIIEFPELSTKFFNNLDILVRILAEKIKAPLDLEEKIAENFFLSWYLWRELCFLEEYNQFFSDGFYKGCFRSLLSIESPHFKEIKKETLQTIFHCRSDTEAIIFLNKKIAEIKRLFK